MNEFAIDSHKVVNLFALFVFGTLALFFSLFSPSIGIELGRFNVPVLMIGIFSYEFVVIDLIKYYVARNKHSFVAHLKSHKIPYLGGIFVVLALSYAVVEYIQNGMLAAVKSVLYAALFVIAIPIVQHVLEKITGTKQKSQETANA